MASQRMMAFGGGIDDLLKALGVASQDEVAQIAEEAHRSLGGKPVWLPNMGPQTAAYFCPADLLLYGGQGGGGKTDLGIGLALTAHRRSLIMRRKYVNLDTIITRAKEIVQGTNYSFNGSPPAKLTTADGRTVVFGANQHDGDEQDYQGQPYDLKYIDEATQLLESQVRFHIGWLRTTDPGQRVRMVLGTNPPISAEGDWIIGMFRPWLDVTHPHPAKPGELRWFVTAPDGTDMEVAGSTPIMLPGMLEELIPQSRTFIPAALKDNPYLVNTGYQAKLDGLPEPIRSAVRDGNFMAARADDEFQVIPTQWVLAAQSRWTANGYVGLGMTAMAIDPAGGGGDDAVLGWRYGTWFAPLEAENGEHTANGSMMAAWIAKNRRDACPVVVDVGGGYGGAVQQRLRDNGVTSSAFNFAAKSMATSLHGRLSFTNKRAEVWWRMREALDPDQEGGSAIALPPDPELRADLTAPTWELTPSGIKLESKDDLRKRLGRSTGRGDCVVMLLSEGNTAAAREMRRKSGKLPQVTLGYSNLKGKR